MNGPTMRRRIEGSARRTVKPSPRSRVRGRMTVSIGEAGSRSANGSSGICQLMVASTLRVSEYAAREEQQGSRVARAHPKASAQAADVAAGEPARARDVDVAHLLEHVLRETFVVDAHDQLEVLVVLQAAEVQVGGAVDGV